MRKNLGKSLVVVLTAILVFSLTAHAANAPKWQSTKTVEIYVPAAAGGNSDLTARIFAERLTNLTGANFLVVNQTEGGGAVCYNTVMRGAPDGSVIGWFTPSWITTYLAGTHDCNPLKDFSVPVMTVVLSPYYVIVPKDSPFNTLEDLTAYCKANPGELVFGMQMGSMSHYFAESFARNVGIELGYVETGSGDAVRVTAILGGNIEATLVNGAQAQQYYQAGELKCLVGIFENPASIPEVMKAIPTLGDLGYKYVDVLSANIMFTPVMDDGITAQIHEAFHKVLHEPAVQERLISMNNEMVMIKGFENTMPAIKDLYDSYRKVAQILGTLAPGR